MEVETSSCTAAETSNFFDLQDELSEPLEENEELEFLGDLRADLKFSTDWRVLFLTASRSRLVGEFCNKSPKSSDCSVEEEDRTLEASSDLLGDKDDVLRLRTDDLSSFADSSGLRKNAGDSGSAVVGKCTLYLSQIPPL